MKERFLKYMQDSGMEVSGKTVLIALSGGGDSVCLLHLFAQCREELGVTLKAVHVHHGIRGDEADRDALFSWELCKRLGVPFFLCREDVPALAAAKGQSLEEAGREARYRIFEEERVRLKADAIAVAHHMDDHAETILHNLFRGSGLRGLSGIPAVRGRIIRPLLGFRHEEILHYLEEEGIEYCIDSTNREVCYTRNRIRFGILPEAERVNGCAVENIARAGEFVREADEYFRGQAARLLGEQCGEDRISFPAGLLKEKEQILASYILMEMVKRAGGGLKDFGAVHIRLLSELLEKPTGSCADLPDGLRAHMEYGRLCIGEKGREQPEAGSAGRLIFEHFPREKGFQIPKKQYTKWFDYDKIKDTLSVRHREPGDYFVLPSGGRKTVKSFMIDEKIPRELRDRILLLAEGKHVLWIVGYRISEYYKVSEDTENILQVRLDGGDTHG